MQAMDIARRREAHERCRRFDAVPRWYPPLAALAHVQGRAADLAQPRPEYGHATNAFCIVGRRARTRGLFLDRRAFLVSYDPTIDPERRGPRAHHGGRRARRCGHQPRVLLQLRGSVWVGWGTKLPHNVTSLLGVMEARRAICAPACHGRWWRYTSRCDWRSSSKAIRINSGASCRAIRPSNGSCETAGSGWPALDPESGALRELQSAGFVAHTPEHALPVVVGHSADWYQGKRGFLPPVAIVPGPGATPDGRVAHAGSSA